MPGVLIVEAMAQAGAVAILSMDEFKGKTAYFGGIKMQSSKRKLYLEMYFVWKFPLKN